MKQCHLIKEFHEEIITKTIHDNRLEIIVLIGPIFIAFILFKCIFTLVI